MSLRLLPFRQYDENDVVNIFALNAGLANADTNTSSDGDNGVFVQISTGNFNKEVIDYTSDSYLGKTDYPFVAGDMYPINPLTVKPATSGQIPFGITLRQTAKNDENGEKLLYNATKREELQAVLPGQTVPVATKGIFTLAAEAFVGSLANNSAAYAVGQPLRMSNSNAGKVTGAAFRADQASGSFGTIIATGSRETTQGGLTDQFGGDFIVVKL